MDSGMQNQDNIIYIDRDMNHLSDEELDQISHLFSENYGIYSKKASVDKRGRTVHMSAQYYRNHYMGSHGYRIGLAVDHGSNSRIVGHAIYLNRQFGENVKISMVIQLVVDRAYRGRGIATSLLSSIWGFTNYTAWGLATSNPCTVKVLEAATCRKCTPSVIRENMEIIQPLKDNVDFLGEIRIDDTQSIVDSQFFVDHSSIPGNIEKLYGDRWRLGTLAEGEEWLAFTFQSQKPEDEEDYKHLRKLLEFSEKRLKSAYGRMNWESQGWQKFASAEVNYILNQIGNPSEISICDFGCGRGRHCTKFANRGHQVVGVDFVPDNIAYAKEHCSEKSERYLCGDCRTIDLGVRFDFITCLYDVIGSFPDDTDNEAIIQNIYRHLKPGGHAAISVMNMELTRKRAKHILDDERNLAEELWKLEPSKTMQQTGDIFEPEYYLADCSKNIVYRKEQFESDGLMPAEYVIRDRRYTGEELRTLLNEAGFVVKNLVYTRAGFLDNRNSSDDKTKEILVIVQKPA
ncbi:MAG: bifunctional GNAT family N-acetyltransferase/class I SAM-dependent methyltransferase [Lachnospiraceae bacterium]|nr:bifunctional GNAT family N-acetyltransferase/class I SAM-dependent methyltransferase [Lachnospiraceae bacterium]